MLSEPIWARTTDPAQSSQEAVVSSPSRKSIAKPDWDAVLTAVEQVWDPNRFDGRVTAVKFQLQSLLGRIAKAAEGSGLTPGDFLVAKATAYMQAVNPGYVVNFSRWLREEGYVRNWTPRPGGVGGMSKSELNLMASMADHARYEAEDRAKIAAGIDPRTDKPFKPGEGPGTSGVPMITAEVVS